jgi:hypothetical protein
MGDTRNEEVIDPNGFRDDAGRPHRLPVHGMSVAWTSLPAAGCGASRHLRRPLPDVQSLRPVRWRSARRHKSEPRDVWPRAKQLSDKEINYETIDDSCSFGTPGEQHGRVSHRRVLAVCLELAVSPTATGCGCGGFSVCDR